MGAGATQVASHPADHPLTILGLIGHDDEAFLQEDLD